MCSKSDYRLEASGGSRGSPDARDPSVRVRASENLRPAHCGHMASKSRPPLHAMKFYRCLQISRSSPRPSLIRQWPRARPPGIFGGCRSLASVLTCLLQQLMSGQCQWKRSCSHLDETLCCPINGQVPPAGSDHARHQLMATQHGTSQGCSAPPESPHGSLSVPAHHDTLLVNKLDCQLEQICCMMYISANCWVVQSLQLLSGGAFASQLILSFSPQLQSHHQQAHHDTLNLWQTDYCPTPE